MKMNIVHLFVRPPAESPFSTPQGIKMLDPALAELGTLYCAQDELPIQHEDGTYEVRSNPAGAAEARRFLTETCKLEIVREDSTSNELDAVGLVSDILSAVLICLDLEPLSNTEREQLQGRLISTNYFSA